ncbi:MAG: hypothetical protein EB084_08585 [Proteobacteria bacterium]|nr:hypothetical protein [Pseudomonadota bacterium]
MLAASMLWPVLGPHLNTPSFDGLVDVVGTLVSKLGVGPIANVLSILQAEGPGNLPFLHGMVNAATDARVCPDERIANLDLLRGLPKGYARRILTFHDAHRDVPLSDLLARVTQSIALDSDLDESLRLATLPAKKEGRVEMGGEEVVVGGIKVRKRKDPSA